MKLFRALGKAVKPLVNFPRWLGWKQISTDGKAIAKMAKQLVKPAKKNRRQETYEQAFSRLNLDEKKIKQRCKQLLGRAIFYVGIALALIIYAFYLLFSKGFFVAVLMALSLALVCLSLAYREHFWYTQIKAKRLGFSFKEWLTVTFKGIK